MYCMLHVIFLDYSCLLYTLVMWTDMLTQAELSGQCLFALLLGRLWGVEWIHVACAMQYVCVGVFERVGGGGHVTRVVSWWCMRAPDGEIIVAATEFLAVSDRQCQLSA